MSVLLGQIRSHAQLPAVDHVFDLLGGTGASVGSTTHIVSVQGKVSDWDIKIAGLASETIDITAISNDSVAISAAQLVLVNTATGNDISGSTLGNGTYKIKLVQYPQIAKLTFTKSSTTDPVRIASVVSVDKPSAL